MKYLESKDGKLTCSHPAVKEISDYGSTSAKPNDLMYYNIKMITHKGVEYVESSTSPDKVKERIEEILQKLNQ